jgi:hypothetical protein
MYWNTKTSGSLVVFFVQIFILLALFQGSSLAFHRRRAAIHGRDRSAADMVGPPSPTALKRNININNNGGEYIVPQPVPPPFHPNGPMPKAGNSPPKVMRIVQTVEVGNTQREGDQQQALAMPANGAGHASGR